ncbi:hypothetical protein Nmel_002732 [Mimus melanotis]
MTSEHLFLNYYIYGRGKNYFSSVKYWDYFKLYKEGGKKFLFIIRINIL